METLEAGSILAEEEVDGEVGFGGGRLEFLMQGMRRWGTGDC